MRYENRITRDTNWRLECLALAWHIHLEKIKGKTIAGQAVTHYQCRGCNSWLVFSSTFIEDVLCHKCKKEVEDYIKIKSDKEKEEE